MAIEKILNKRSNAVVTDGGGVETPKKPTSSQLDNGEIAVNYHKGMERIFMKNDNEEVVEFIPKNEVEANYYDKDGTDTLLAGKVDKEQGKGLSTNDYTDNDKDKLTALPTATELTQELDGKADIGRVEDIEDALSVVETETADATNYTTETTSVSMDNITINPVAVRRSTIYSVYKQGGGQENIEGVFSPGYTSGTYILNVQIAQSGTVKINSIRTRYYSGYYPIVYFYFTPTGGEKVKVAEIGRASSGTPTGYKYEEPTISINAPGAGVLSIELWLYDIDTYNTIPAFYWMEYELASVVYYAITSINFDKSSLTGFVNNGSYNSTTKKIEMKHDSDILAEIDTTAFIADLATVATSGSYNDLSDKPDLSGFITNSVNNLVNYYLKTETYTKTEVDNKIGDIETLLATI